jgi:hypothetical protein
MFQFRVWYVKTQANVRKPGSARTPATASFSRGSQRVTAAAGTQETVGIQKE